MFDDDELMKIIKSPHDYFTLDQSVEEIEAKLDKMDSIDLDIFPTCTGCWITEHGFFLSSCDAFWRIKPPGPDGHAVYEEHWTWATEAQGIWQSMRTWNKNGRSKE